MSCSGRLVTQMNRFGWLEVIRSSNNSKSSSRADGVPVAFGHSSRASMIRKVGSCPGSSSMPSRHPARAASLGCVEPSRHEVYNS